MSLPPPATAPDVALEFDGVSKAFVAGKRTITALCHVGFAVRRGRVSGLIGPDGAGKTTLMRLAVGLLTPDQGRVRALGFDAARQSPEVQSRVGYMPQRFGLYEDLSVRENLDLYADLQGLARPARPGRYEELMHMTGLGRFTTRLAGRLSGGMKQKLGLACTLIRPPRLLLLDEPTVGVDPVSRRELWQIVYRLVQQEHMTVLLSTAYLDEAERCDDVILMHEGEVLGQGPPETFRNQSLGRTYRLAAPGRRKRAVQATLAEAPSVVDALIQGETIRLVTDSDSAPEPAKLLPDMPGVSIVPTPPRLEDSFVAMLKKRRAVTPPVSILDRAGAGPLPGRNDRVIEVQGVKRRFGSFFAVKGVTFDVERGEVFGLLGANGAGKSTTFRMLCGLLPATEGSLRVAGLDLRRAAAAARARIGYMSQKFSLYGHLSVCENLRFFSSAYGLSGSPQRDRLDWALQQFELGSLADVTSADLPLGHKQRLAMACALMHKPEILFLDEPTSGVDPLARRDFWSRINALAEQQVTILVTTHFMEEAEYCDRLAIMAEGEILALGTPEEIKRRQAAPSQPEPTLEDAFIGLINKSQPA